MTAIVPVVTARVRLPTTVPSAADVAGGTVLSVTDKRAFAARSAAGLGVIPAPIATAGMTNAAIAAEKVLSNATAVPEPAPLTAPVAVAPATSRAASVARRVSKSGPARTVAGRVK